MCIMAIHATATTANAIQAMAHNADTLESDLTQLRHLLEGRGDYERLAWIDRELERIRTSTDNLWNLWQSCVAEGTVAKGSQTATGWEADRKEDKEAREHSHETFGEEATALAALNTYGA